jgi:MFS transporter, MHS family, proline/betaine transporter
VRAEPSQSRRAIVAGAIGNIMEWYDFAVYGFFAAILGRQFFPAEDPLSSLLAAFGVFAAGYLMRPFGSIVFGHIGDRVGRKAALTLSVAAMAIPTFLIGILPTHAQIGATASALLVVLRLIQGLSVGGECATSTIFLVEQASIGRRGFLGSWAMFGAIAGILLGSAVGALVLALFGAAAAEAWAWRLPFLFGVVLGIAGLYLRRTLAVDTIAPADRPTRLPVVEAFSTEWRTIIRVFGLNIVQAVGFYLCFVYVTTYLRQVDFISTSKALDINSLSMLVLLLMMPVAGLLADRVGRKPVLLVAVTGILVLSYPLFWLMHHPATAMIMLGQLGFSIILGLYLGTLPAVVVEIFPRRVRCSAMSISYNAAIGLFGGTAPMVAVYLIERSHNDLSPAFYLMAMAAVSLAAVLSIKETAWSPMPSDAADRRAQALAGQTRLPT